MIFMSDHVDYRGNWDKCNPGIHFPKFFPGDEVITHCPLNGEGVVQWTVCGVRVGFDINDHGEQLTSKTWHYQLLHKREATGSVTVTRGVETMMKLVSDENRSLSSHSSIQGKFFEASPNPLWVGYRIRHEDNPMCVGICLSQDSPDWDVNFVTISEDGNDLLGPQYTMKLPLRREDAGLDEERDDNDK